MTFSMSHMTLITTGSSLTVNRTTTTQIMVVITAKDGNGFTGSSLQHRMGV